MDETTLAVRTYFAKLGLPTEVADMYVALHTHGPQTISELSRNSKVERTRIYRLIDTLLSSNLVEVESHHKRGVIKAAPIANLHILISQKEQELKSLQDELDLIQQVLGRNSLSDPSTRVQFYKGAEGYKQMYWNQTEAKGPGCAILHETMQVKTKSSFFDRWVTKCNERGLHFRGIVNDSFLTSLEFWYTNNPSTEKLKHWEARYVDKEIFSITHSTLVYDDVVAFFNWKDDEIFGVEIYNPEVAHSQKQLFELLWEKSRPLENTRAASPTPQPSRPAKTQRS